MTEVAGRELISVSICIAQLVLKVCSTVQGNYEGGGPECGEGGRSVKHCAECLVVALVDHQRAALSCIRKYPWAFCSPLCSK